MIKSINVFQSNPPAQFDGVFNWDFLKGAFGPRIEPMDFDGVVERNGYFLIFETKTPGTLVPDGQTITFENLVRCDTRFTIIFCAKQPADICAWDVWTNHGRVHYDGNAATLKAWCSAWFEHVSQCDPPWFGG